MFDNTGNSSLVLTRALLANNEIHKPYLLNSRAQGVSEKKNNLPKHHGAGPQRRGVQYSCNGCTVLRPALPRCHGPRLLVAIPLYSMSVRVMHERNSNDLE